MPIPDICLEDRETCPNELRVLFFDQDTCGMQEVSLRDRHGKPLNLENSSVKFLAKEDYRTQQFYLCVPAEITGPAEGVVKVTLDRKQLPKPGLFLSEFVVTPGAAPAADDSSSSEESSEEGSDSSSEEEAPEICPTARICCYTEVRENLSVGGFDSQAISIAEIRLAIRDKCREDNFLLDNVEFSDTEIAWAIRQPVDYWNEEPPPLRPRHTPSTFPYRYNWRLGIIGELLSLASLNYERNRLQYSAAGLTVDDKNKVDFYAKAADRYKEEYKAWVIKAKVSINLGLAYRSTYISSFGNRSFR